MIIDFELLFEIFDYVEFPSKFRMYDVNEFKNFVDDGKLGNCLYDLAYGIMYAYKSVGKNLIRHTLYGVFEEFQEEEVYKYLYSVARKVCLSGYENDYMLDILSILFMVIEFVYSQGYVSGMIWNSNVCEVKYKRTGKIKLSNGMIIDADHLDSTIDLILLEDCCKCSPKIVKYLEYKYSGCYTNSIVKKPMFNQQYIVDCVIGYRIFDLFLGREDWCNMCNPVKYIFMNINVDMDETITENIKGNRFLLWFRNLSAYGMRSGKIFQFTENSDADGFRVINLCDGKPENQLYCIMPVDGVYSIIRQFYINEVYSMFIKYLRANKFEQFIEEEVQSHCNDCIETNREEVLKSVDYIESGRKDCTFCTNCSYYGNENKSWNDKMRLFR